MAESSEGRPQFLVHAGGGDAGLAQERHLAHKLAQRAAHQPIVPQALRRPRALQRIISFKGHRGYTPIMPQRSTFSRQPVPLPTSTAGAAVGHCLYFYAKGDLENSITLTACREARSGDTRLCCSSAGSWDVCEAATHPRLLSAVLMALLWSPQRLWIPWSRAGRQRLLSRRHCQRCIHHLLRLHLSLLDVDQQILAHTALSKRLAALQTLIHAHKSSKR